MAHINSFSDIKYDMSLIDGRFYHSFTFSSEGKSMATTCKWIIWIPAPKKIIMIVNSIVLLPRGSCWEWFCMPRSSASNRSNRCEILVKYYTSTTGPPEAHLATTDPVATRRLASTGWLASGGPLEGHWCYVCGSCLLVLFVDIIFTPTNNH